MNLTKHEENVELVWTGYDDVDPTLRLYAEEFKRVQHTIGQQILLGGKVLSFAKDKLPRGTFDEWVDAEFGISRATAYKYIGVFEKFGTVSQLDGFTARALYTLASPEVPDEARAEAVEAAERGERITEPKAAEIVERHRPEPEPDDIDDDFGDVPEPPKDRTRLAPDPDEWTDARERKEIAAIERKLRQWFDVWPDGRADALRVRIVNLAETIAAEV